ncbi:TPA: hypothetical protein ACSTLY_000286 [Serratia fonticola]
MNIPIPEYCTLERAAKLIDCEVSDLIHFGEIGAITICIKVPKSTKAMLHVFKNDESTMSDIEAEWAGGDIYSQFVTIDEPTEHMKEDRSMYKLPAFISGVWGLFKCSEFGNVFTEIPCDEMVVLKAVDSNILAFLEFPGKEWGVDEKITTLPTDMLVLGQDLETLIKNAGSRVPCRWNEFEKTFDIKASGKVINCNEDTLSPKTINSRAQFIKALLCSTYSKDLADNPRKYLDDPNSEINVDFRNKGLKIPSGRTVQSWLSMVDIPFIKDDL